MKFDLTDLDSFSASRDWLGELREISKAFSVLKKGLLSSDAVKLDKELHRRINSGFLLSSAPIICFTSPSRVTRSLREVEFIQVAWNQNSYGTLFLDGWLLQAGTLKPLESFERVEVLEDGIQQYIQTSSRTKIVGVGPTLELLNIGGKAPAVHHRNELKDTRDFELVLTGKDSQLRQKFKSSGVQTVRALLPVIEGQLGTSPTAQPPQSSSIGLAAELEALMGLKNQGVLSEGEFAAAKAKLLGL